MRRRRRARLRNRAIGSPRECPCRCWQACADRWGQCAGRYESACFLIREVTCDGGSVVAVADGNYLAVGLNEHSVSKGFAAAEWCAYKSAVAERGVNLSVGSVACQTKVGRTGNSVYIGESGLSSRDNVAICLEDDSEGLSQDMAGEWCCYSSTVAAEAVIDCAVAVIAHDQEARNAVSKCQARRSSKAAGGYDMGAFSIACRVGSNDKSSYV